MKWLFIAPLMPRLLGVERHFWRGVTLRYWA